MQNHSNKKYLFLVLILISAFICGIFISCEKSDPNSDTIVLPITSSISYLKLDLNRVNQLTITQESTYAYKLTTTGSDPYVFTQGISKALNQDSVVLTFEYKSNADISTIQIFFGSDITEKHSIKFGGLSKTNSWQQCSFNLYNIIDELSWGELNDFIRIDFGDQSDINIEIQKMYFRSMNDTEQKKINEEKLQAEKNESINNSLMAYLASQFSSKITEVEIGANTISITGKYVGNGKFSLCEIYPNDTLTATTLFKNKTALEDPHFHLILPRTINKNGVEYDRLLSKWVIVKESSQKDEIVSFARYADKINAKQTLEPGVLSSKKGLGGFFMNDYSSDLDLLGITSITINIPITAFMYTGPVGNTFPHTFGNKTYYFSRDYIAGLDNALKFAATKKIVVAAIILVQKASECPDPQIGELLQHPDYTSEGIYTMPNLTTEEGVNCYAVALDYLASRYNRTDNAYGRIHKWIMHNEVDAGLTWTNMGNKPMLVYLDTYIKSMRICYNITRQYDINSEILGSFTHSWNEPEELYSSKEMLKFLQKFSVAEGDFQWGIAYHSYPQDLNEPKTWKDAKATFSQNSSLVTFKNLEVIDYWVKQTENKYNGLVKRTLWLSENGTNSRSYSEQDLSEQAAGFAYAWKKIKVLDGIDAIQWHNWLDNRYEYGLRIGLRKFPDDKNYPAAPKPVWYLYQAAGTDNEDIKFDAYKSLIGINDWSEIMHTLY